MTAVDGFTPLIGGIPIVIDGQVVGGIGVSGAASANQDEELALAGATAFTESSKTDPPSKSSSASDVSGAPMMKSTSEAIFIDGQQVAAALTKGQPLLETPWLQSAR
jgi:Haem-degrading